jgi:hypothetical protein
VALAALAAVPVFNVAPATAYAAPSVSTFTGSWSGTWSDVEIEADGTFDWTISDAGRLSGTVYITGGEAGAMVGHVRADGMLVFVGFTPACDPTFWNGVPWQGTALIDGDGKLVVSVARTDVLLHLVAILERN